MNAKGLGPLARRCASRSNASAGVGSAPTGTHHSEIRLGRPFEELSAAAHDRDVRAIAYECFEGLDRLPDRHVHDDQRIGIYGDRRRVAGVVLQSPHVAGRLLRDRVHGFQIGDEIGDLGRVQRRKEPGYIHLRYVPRVHATGDATGCGRVRSSGLSSSRCCSRGATAVETTTPRANGRGIGQAKRRPRWSTRSQRSRTPTSTSRRRRRSIPGAR